MTNGLTYKFSQRADWCRKQAISYLMQQGIENRGVVSLAAGFVDSATLPIEVTGKAVSHLLAKRGEALSALQYGTTSGHEGLRVDVLNHLARLENVTPERLGIDPSQVLLTTGSQQFLAILADIVFDPGDICLVAAPTYFVFLGVLNGVGARTIAIETDEHGMVPSSLDACLGELASRGLLAKVKLIYLVSYYENPSGISLSTERRPEILRIARKWSKQQRILILEDAAYRELRYDGEVHPSIFSYDSDHSTVILTQTFSKTFSPGIRVGYGVVPREVIVPFGNRKGNEDFGSPNFNQSVLAEVLENGWYHEHVERVRTAYRAKRDVMLEAADQYFADMPEVTWVHPNGGLYVWMSLPKSIATGFQDDFFRKATREHGVMYVPGELCYPDDASQNHQMRLSFGVESKERLADGMKRLAAAVRSTLVTR